MASIRGRDAKPEFALRSLLHRAGYRFTVRGPLKCTLPGRPDLVPPRYRTVVTIWECALREKSERLWLAKRIPALLARGAGYLV